MNKQELINSVKAWGAWCTDHNTGEKDRYVKIDKVRELIEQLDEKQKVTVPNFVAIWLKQCKEKATLADCLDGCYEISNGEVVSSEDFQNWVVDNENDELTAKAWMFGYEVEKEPNFIVKVGNLYLIEPLGDTSDSTIRTTWNHKNAYEFTSYDIAQTHANKFGGEVEEVK
ncbi:DUF1642 domain-containing protein [Enterococcus sp. DIV1096b]|uniref:DUF1642 domain-containing protein n=1 Tax=Enterococcus sp. DIV1096b TaxID=2774709 RepID=UPI003D2C5396